MITIQSIHILWLILIAALLYAVWMVRYLNRIGKSNKTPPEVEKKRKGDIVGKSSYVLPQRHLTPQAAIAPKDDDVSENSDTFVPNEETQHPRQIPDAELDEVFGAVPEGETNKPMDISYSPEDEDRDEEDEYDVDDLEAEREDLPIQSRREADGFTFEEMGDAYRHVVESPKITDKEKENTGRILLNMQHTDMFEVLVSGKPQREDKVADLVDAYLTSFHKKMSEENGESPTLRGVVPDDFNIGDILPE